MLGHKLKRVLHKSIYYIYFYFGSILLIFADLPELSALNPIEFDEINQKITASGDATFDFDNIKLKADKIVYYKNYDLLDARGNINFTTENHRLLAESFSLNTNSNDFYIQNIKYGNWPYFINADSGGGSLEGIRLNEGVFYYGEPSIFTPNFKAKSISLVNKDDEKRIIFNDASIRLGNLTILYLPRIKYNLDRNSLLGISNIGYASEFGPYFQSLTLIPISEFLRVGFNFDYYSDRGLLAGPVAQYFNQKGNSYIRGSFSTGYINDRGFTGVDILNRPIISDRKFILAQHKQALNENFYITAQSHNLSDSEVLRDFKEPLYAKNQFPMNFIESNYFHKISSISAFIHFKNDDFSNTRERLPELRFSLKPHYLFNTSINNSAYLSFSKIKEDNISPYSLIYSPENLTYSQIDLNYKISSNYYINNWLKITPKIESRSIINKIDKDKNGLMNNIFEDPHHILYYGLNFSSEHEAIYSTFNQLWNINGLRHLIRPTLSYIKIKSPDSSNFNLLQQTQISPVLDLALPIQSLSDYRNIDQINEKTITRLSFENFFQTRTIPYGSRNLMELHLTADFYNNFNNRNSNDSISEKNALWLEYSLYPASWIKFDLGSRLELTLYEMQEFSTRLTLKSGEIWKIGLGTYFKEDFTNQVSLDYFSKLSEKITLSSIVWADIDKNKITRLKLGIDFLSRSNWMTSYSLNYRDDQRRDKDLSLDIGVELLPY